MKYNRFLPLFIPLSVLLLSEVFFLYPKMIYVILVLVNLAIFFVLRQFSKASEIDKKWWNFFILPSLMSSVVLIYSVFLGSKIIIQLLFAANAVLLYIYLRYTYYYLLKPLAYESFSIENISSFSNFLIFFLLASTIYGLQSFLNISVWILELFILIVTFLIVYQIIWVNKIDFRRGAPYILICCLILVELSWAMSFLPFNRSVLGIGLAVCYYVLMGLVRNHLLDKLDSKKVKVYLTVGLVSLFLVFFTARWI